MPCGYPREVPVADSKADIKSVSEQLHQLNELIKELKKIGAQVEELEKVTNRLQTAIDTGIDLGNAAAETSAALAEYSNNVYKACGDDFVCQAKFDSLWQARSVNWTLSLDRQNSVVRNFIRATLQRYVPQRICEHLDACKSRK
jgi:conjugal transfer/entry exclusion protein